MTRWMLAVSLLTRFAAAAAGRLVDRWVVVSLLSALVGAAAPASALAQTAVYLLTPPSAGSASPPQGTITRIDPETPAIVSSAAVPAPLGFGFTHYVTPDGRLLVWLGANQAGARHVALHDLVTSQTSFLAAPPTARAVVGHPHRAELFLTDAVGPVALSSAGTRPIAHACAGAGSFPLTISADGSRVLYACDAGPNLPQLLVVDTTAYVALGVRPWGAVTQALGADGHDLYVVSGGRLHRYDTDSGTLVVDVPVPTTFAGQPESVRVVRVDPLSGRVFVVGRGVHVFDGVSLQLQGSSAAPWTGASAPEVTGWTFDPSRPRAFVSWFEPLAGAPPPSARPGYAVMDTATGAPIVQVLGSYGDLAGTFAVAQSPDAPTALTGTATSGRVELAWAPSASPAAVSTYVLEAGSMPGASDVIASLQLGLQTSLAASGVPPGTYYVRVRAANHAGLSAPSNEVVVQVP